MLTKPVLASAAALVILAGCQTTTEEAAVTKPLAPMEKPSAWTMGSNMERLKDGKPYSAEVIAVDAETTTWKNSEGCIYTLKNGFGFGSSVTWENCPSSRGTQSGTQTIEKLDDNPIWPLKVGKSWRYREKGSNTNGNSWNMVRKCDVEKEVKITTQLGTFDTFKVICVDDYRERTWYIAPDYGTSVKFINHNSSRNSTTVYDTISFSKPAS